MIGIVIVSHSAKLAEGVVELARGMGGPDLLIRATGGLDLAGQPLGTDPMAVLAAIEEVYSEDGVLVLMDLGSAVLSAEMALDLLPPEKRTRVLLCEAPVVEGAVAAAVQARLGNSLERAVDEARGALAAKAAHLGYPNSLLSAEQPTLPPALGAEIELLITVNNPLGLHARPAARLVQAAGRFPQVNIQATNLTAGRGPANASSINALAMLGVRRGHEVLVTFAGAGAEAACAAVQTLAAENFGDREIPSAPVQQGQPEVSLVDEVKMGSRLPGLPISPGIAVGPAWRFQPALPQIDNHLVSDPQAEWEGLLAALAKTRTQIQANRDAAAAQIGGGAASILEAHLLFLDDEALRGPARTAIFAGRLNAGAAWNQAIQYAADGYRGLDDPYLQARAADVEEVGRQVLFNLLGCQEAPLKFEQPGILVAASLSLADAARLDPQVVLGICLAYGSPSSHSSILVRSLGIPAVGGLGEAVLKLADGTLLVIDSEYAEVRADPGEAAVEEYTRRSQTRRSARAAEMAASIAPAITRDGRRIEVAANITSATEARAALSWGAEGVGVFRTEFLFLNRPEAPGEDEQYAAYRSAAEGLAGRSLIIRTLDAGGDKPIPYLNLPTEANPFLGVRAVRLCLARPGLFKTQLRAILRAAVDFPVKVMYPMIAAVEEWQAVGRLLAEARDELRSRGSAAPDKIDAGIMVEIPSAALCAARFAEEVDFFSIGTNDLVQYTLASERGNPALAALADGFHPAVLELIYRVAEAAHARGKWAGVCGEMAGDPLAAPVLVGLGIDELSMNAPAIPRIKQVIRFSDYSLLRGRAVELLSLPTAQAVRKAAALLSRQVQMGAKTISRRQFLMLTGGLALDAVAAGLSIELYASQIEPLWIQVHRMTVRLTGLPKVFENFTIAQFSDLHAGAYLRIEDVRRCVAMTNALGADAIVITGDFIIRDTDDRIAWAPELALLRARYGVFAVLGNHDAWSDPDRISAELAGAGVQVLRNESTAIEIAQSRLWLAGVEDIGYKGMRLAGFIKANEKTVARLGVMLAELPRSDPRILLVHNPDFTELLPEGRVDLALCGHTHGGQVHLPFFGSPIVPSFFGHKYTSGMVRGPKTNVYINRGIGVVAPPVRFNCRPEITFFRLRS